MTTYTYRQPVAGQAFVDLIEGTHPKMALDRFVGKYVAVCCFGSSRIGPGRAALNAMRRHKTDFDDVKTVFLGIAIDPGEKVESITQTGIYYHLDTDGAMSRQCGAAPREAVPLGTQHRVTGRSSIQVCGYGGTFTPWRIPPRSRRCLRFSTVFPRRTNSNRAKARRPSWLCRVCSSRASAKH